MLRTTRPTWLAVLAVLTLAGLTLGCLTLGGRTENPESSATNSAPPATPPESAPPAVTPPALIDIPNARMATPSILVGGQPSVEQLEEAARAGYRTIVNLRTPGEQGVWDEATKAAELGLSYISIPIAGKEDIHAEAASRLAEILDAPETLPAMVHCASGNRVGALFALNAHHLDGADVETALAAGRNAGLTKLEGAVRELLENPGE